MTAPLGAGKGGNEPPGQCSNSSLRSPPLAWRGAGTTSGRATSISIRGISPKARALGDLRALSNAELQPDRIFQRGTLY